MYFNHAFKKVYVSAVNAGAISLRTTGSTQDLTAGQLGLFDAKTYAAIAAAGAVNQPFILAQGSYRTQDKIGKFHGGYKESIKSKTINPKYVSRFFKVNAVTPLSQIIDVSGLDITCGNTYQLRLDIKGSPALRTLKRNAYHTLDAFAGCCADGCDAPCNGDPVDENVILLQWAAQINEDPIISLFVRAYVLNNSLATTGTTSVAAAPANVRITALASTAGVAVGDYVTGPGVGAGAKVVTVDSGTQVTVDKPSTAAGTGVAIQFSKPLVAGTYVPVTGAGAAAVVGHLRIEAAYEDTKFGDCTFSVTDHYELAPLRLYVSAVDETGDPCAVKNIINSSTGVGVTEIQAARQASGTGESVLRDLTLFMRYLQDPFPEGASVDSLRMREVQLDPSLGTVARTGLYDQVCILHSVPRFNNPSGTFDDDQYLLVVNVPTGTVTTTFTTLVSNILTAGGNPTALEQF